MEVPVSKNKEYVVDIIDNGFGGEGIAKIDNFTIFISNAIKGERVRIIIVKVLTSHAFGKLIEVLKSSPYREGEDCQTYKRCGGCQLRHIKYEETLKIKQNAVQSLVNKALRQKIEVEETLGMDEPYHYRNKAQYPLGMNKEGKPVMGVFANRTHEIIPIQDCLIQNKQAEEVAKFIFDFIVENKISIYDEKKQKGLMRHIVTKIGIKTDEIMCVLVINGNEIPQERELINQVTKTFPNVKTIVKNINKQNTNVILGKKNICIYGNGVIEDKLGELIFKISPLSFYQVNPTQAQKLYQIGVDAAQITKQDIVFDLYCGIGTISLFMAPFARKVYGIELIEEAVNSAKENAIINKMDNVEFIAGDVEKILDDLINKRKIIPDIVMVDPPRRGLDKKSIENILKILPKRLVYISCNPATLVRDLSNLEGLYEIKRIKPVDMFPFTSHVEVCALLELKNCQ